MTTALSETVRQPPIGLTSSQLSDLALGLGQLDGLRLSPDSFKPFKFEDDTVWKIASNQSLIVAQLAVFDRAKKLLVGQHEMVEGMKITPENAERVQAFMAALDSLQQRVIDVPGLAKIKRSELKVGANQISPSTLARLMPILEE